MVGGSTRALSGSSALLTFDLEAGREVMTGPGELILVVCELLVNVGQEDERDAIHTCHRLQLTDTDKRYQC